MHASLLLGEYYTEYITLVAIDVRNTSLQWCTSLAMSVQMLIYLANSDMTLHNEMTYYEGAFTFKYETCYHKTRTKLPEMLDSFSVFFGNV